MKLSKIDFSILIGGGALFLFLSWWLHGFIPLAHRFCDVDSSAYLRNGFLFYKYGSFSPFHAPQPLPAYGLGYPLLIGVIYKFFGPSSDYVVLIQIFLSVLSGFLIFCIARNLFNIVVARLAYVLWSVNIGFLTFSHFILTENFLSFFYLLFFYFFTAFLKSGATKKLFIAGLLLGSSIAIKPAALYFVILLLPVVCLFNASRLKNLMFFLIAFAVPVVGLMGFNKKIFNQFQVGALDSVNLYYWFYPNVLACKNGTTSDSEREILQKKDVAIVKRDFYSDARQAPLLFLSVWVKNVFKTWVGLFTTNVKVLVNPEVHGGAISFFKCTGSLWTRCYEYVTNGANFFWIKFIGIYEAIWLMVRLPLLVIGLISLIWHGQYLLWWFIVTYLSYFSFITGHDGCARFRMFFEFVLIMLNALGIYFIARYLYKKVVKYAS